MAAQESSEEPMDTEEAKVIEWYFRLYLTTYNNLYDWFLNGNGIRRGLNQFKEDIPELGIRKKDYLVAIPARNKQFHS